MNLGGPGVSSGTAQRLPAAQGMVSAAVCVRVDVCEGYVALPEVRFKRKSQKYDQFSLKSMLVVPSQFDSLKSVLSL